MNKNSCFFTIIIVLLFFGCNAEKDVDTSTPEDWKTNVALRDEYRGALIFTAVETTLPNGKREVCLTAHDRKAFVVIFQQLKLNGIPSLKARRDRILNMVEKAPGGNRINMPGDLCREVDSFWDEVLNRAKKHGVSPE